jgi:putative oxidoreductase
MLLLFTEQKFMLMVEWFNFNLKKNEMNKYINLIGRILFALMFLMPALNKITNFEGTQQYMASKNMPMIPFLLVCAIVILLFGAFSIGAGFKSKIGSIALIVFLIPATLIFHNELSDQNQFIHFLKNVALIGGLLILFVNGTGELSLDNKVKS